MEPRDRVTELLVETLAQAVALPGEHRLFRSGKLDGLFPGRTGVSAEAASRAIREGLLQRVRLETKGKTEIEWVAVTPAGIEFLHQQQSPVEALRALRAVLRANQESIPIWQEDMRSTLRQLEARLTADADAVRQRLAGLERQVGEALQRLEAASPMVPPEILQSAPWAIDALNYLDRRRNAGAAHDCTLPELFSAVVANRPELGLAAFHEGLRQLHRRRALRLRPAEKSEAITQPEFALLEEACVCYYAVR
jgi:hypothetical protein